MHKLLFACIVFILQATEVLAHPAADTCKVYFPFNESKLTDAARQHIDSAIYAQTIQLTQLIKIVGYTDAVGGDTFNLRLSRQRAASVKAYLIQSGFRKENITLIIGHGEKGAIAPERPGGNIADRRVDIVPVGLQKAVLPPPQKFYLQPVKKKGDTSLAGQRAQGMDIGKMEVGKTMVLGNIYFYPGRHVVRPESDAALNDLHKQLIDNPAVRIRIEGHVCCVTTPDALDNDTRRENLSVSRAEAIRDYLISRGIMPTRLESRGFGRSHPVILNERTEEDANKNRRVEVRVIK